MKMLLIISDVLEKILKYLLIIITAVMIMTICYQVFMRYVLSRSPSWTEEVGRIFLVWIGFLGASLLVKYRRNIRVEFFVNKIIKSSSRKSIDLITDFTILAFSILMITLGIKQVMFTWEYSTEAVHIPMYFFNSSVPLSGFMMAIFSMTGIIQNISKYHHTYMKVDLND